jgi:hypothetical protein
VIHLKEILPYENDIMVLMAEMTILFYEINLMVSNTNQLYVNLKAQEMANI